MKNYIAHKDFELHYHIFGNGKEYLLAFHGFSRTGEDFRVFQSSLGTKYTLIAIDLFHHGGSKYPERSQALQKKELKEMVNVLLEKHHISFFSVMGYSLGGKIALVCIELFAERIRDLFLLAPDGIQPLWSYKFASGTWIGRKIFQYTIKHPQALFRLMKLLRKYNMISQNLYSFLLFHAESSKHRQFVFNVWLTFRAMKPDLNRIAKYINQYNINVQAFFGKYDSIVPPETGKTLTKGLKNKNVVHIVDNGHRLITEKMNTYFKAHPQLWS